MKKKGKLINIQHQVFFFFLNQKMQKTITAFSYIIIRLNIHVYILKLKKGGM